MWLRLGGELFLCAELTWVAFPQGLKAPLRSLLTQGPPLLKACHMTREWRACQRPCRSSKRKQSQDDNGGVHGPWLALPRTAVILTARVHPTRPALGTQLPAAQGLKPDPLQQASSGMGRGIEPRLDLVWKFERLWTMQSRVSPRTRGLDHGFVQDLNQNRRSFVR